jgi:hypothetical protein
MANHPNRGRVARLEKALQELVWAVEADHRVQGIDPRSVLHAHTYVAVAMQKADKVLGSLPRPSLCEGK